jgi:predicted small secreted protein
MRAISRILIGPAPTAGRETIKGIGKDIEPAGEAIQRGCRFGRLDSAVKR